MNRIKQIALGLTSALLALGAMAASIDVGGLKMEDAAEVRGNKLVLNGAGVRYKAMFKVYAAGLYLGKKSPSLEEVLAATGAKRVHLVMLRDIDSNELGKLFTRGVQDNAPKTEMSQLVPGLIRMGQIFSNQKKLVAGDVITIDWIPGTGSVVTVKGLVQGEPFKEAEFFNALIRIWLGPTPADWKLKDALLGKPA